MDVFHYVAEILNELDIPNFEHAVDTAYDTKDEGAIYNDFDFDAKSLLSQTRKRCSTPSTSPEPCSSHSLSSFVPDEAIELALLKADDDQGIFYKYLTYEIEEADCVSSVGSTEYLEKVKAILTKPPEELAGEFTEEVTEIYNMRYRNNWDKPDTVYDAWLVSNDVPRSVFPMTKFLWIFPDWHSFKERRCEDILATETEPSRKRQRIAEVDAEEGEDLEDETESDTTDEEVSTNDFSQEDRAVVKDVLNYALSVIMLNETIDYQKLCSVEDEDSGIVVLSD